MDSPLLSPLHIDPGDYPYSEVDSLSDSDWLDISSSRESDDLDSDCSRESYAGGDGPRSRRSSSSNGSIRDAEVDAWEGLVEDAVELLVALLDEQALG